MPSVDHDHEINKHKLIREPDKAHINTSRMIQKKKKEKENTIE